MSSDQSLMARVREGDHLAFSTLVERHTDRFYLLALKTLHSHAEAEDIVQSAFIKLWQKPYQWNEKRGEFTTWFYQVILNSCRDTLRKPKYKPLDTSPEIEQHVAHIPSEERRYEDTQTVDQKEKLIQRALKQLPASQKEAINLVVYCELPQLQAAKVMGLKLKAFESLLSRARTNLKKYCLETLQNQNHDSKKSRERHHSRITA